VLARLLQTKADQAQSSANVSARFFLGFESLQLGAILFAQIVHIRNDEIFSASPLGKAGERIRIRRIPRGVQEHTT